MSLVLRTAKGGKQVWTLKRRRLPVVVQPGKRWQTVIAVTVTNALVAPLVTHKRGLLPSFDFFQCRELSACVLRLEGEPRFEGARCLPLSRLEISALLAVGFQALPIVVVVKRLADEFDSADPPEPTIKQVSNKSDLTFPYFRYAKVVSRQRPGRWHTGSMPELPDITVYVESLDAKVHGATLNRIRIQNPFLLRTAVPPIAHAEGRRVLGIERLGKRVVLALEGDLFLVIHLMIAGRLRWLPLGAKPPGKASLAAFEFDAGTLVLTEAGSKRRASLHLLAGRDALRAADPGGIDVLASDLPAFAAQLARENHTLKRSLTDPRLFSGIGNAYSDEILHRARLSPLALSRSLDAEGTQRLFDATRAVLGEWIARLGAEAAQHGGWPDKVTAFHPAMTVHGRYGQPCPVCGAPVQRIVHADNETNYCARCQTGGKLLADRALSRLLKASWPRHIDDIE